MSDSNPKAYLLKNLRRGDLVRAIRHVDPEGADVPKLTPGVVFEEAEFHEQNSGPMVRFFTGGMCNVYVDDVELVESKTGPNPELLFQKERYRELYAAKVTGMRWSVTVRGRHDEETHYERELGEAYSFVRDLCLQAGYPLMRVQEHFADEKNDALYIHVKNTEQVGDKLDRHILFARL